jgi:hypothetical protein
VSNIPVCVSDASMASQSIEDRTSIIPDASLEAGLASSDLRSALRDAMQRLSTLVLTPEELAELARPFPRSDVRQLVTRSARMDYLPHILISRRLLSVLGSQWALVCTRRWVDREWETCYAEYHLVVRGVWVGDTIAGFPYQPANRQMDYADAMEGTRGIALRRLAAKNLGCGDQVWQGGDRPANDEPRPVHELPSPGQQHTPIVPHPDPYVVGCYAALRQAASEGTESLRVAWAALSIEERRRLVEELGPLKQTASDADLSKAKKAG